MRSRTPPPRPRPARTRAPGPAPGCGCGSGGPRGCRGRSSPPASPPAPSPATSVRRNRSRRSSTCQRLRPSIARGRPRRSRRTRRPSGRGPTARRSRISAASSGRAWREPGAVAVGPDAGEVVGQRLAAPGVLPGAEAARRRRRRPPRSRPAGPRLAGAGSASGSGPGGQQPAAPAGRPAGRRWRRAPSGPPPASSRKSECALDQRPQAARSGTRGGGVPMARGGVLAGQERGLAGGRLRPPRHPQGGVGQGRPPAPRQRRAAAPGEAREQELAAGQRVHLRIRAPTPHAVHEDEEDRHPAILPRSGGKLSPCHSERAWCSSARGTWPRPSSRGSCATAPPPPRRSSAPSPARSGARRSPTSTGWR